ncbi:MAG: 4-alpha-glucanotransferase, partial [Elusimicrobia bacterium]|nr:4-alpha-glucanotransferase [Elusimicrobiota bacterium]
MAPEPAEAHAVREAAPAPAPQKLSRRAAGVLLHASSLPGPHGVGDLGPAAYRFVDFLKDAGQHWWQMLPVVPPGPGDSPYSSPSAFAGNPLFISLEALVQDGFLADEDLAQAPEFSARKTDYDAAEGFKEELLRKAFARFSEKGRPEQWDDFRAFCVETSDWLDDYGLFCALKKAHGGKAWSRWEEPLRHRRFRFWSRETVRQAGEESAYRQFVQYLFRRQWEALRNYAAARGVGFIGDVPLYVAYDSAEVWSRPEIFRLDADLRPEAVAGVPPDYFSRDGQLWGNPLYRWDKLAEDGYSWWTRRLLRASRLFDAVRLDHFIGFARYWAVPAGAKTARGGEWTPGPGHDFFAAVRKQLPELQIIAEDLGLVGPDVSELRDAFRFPGIKVLQFSMGDGRVEDPPQGYP